MKKRRARFSSSFGLLCALTLANLSFNQAVLQAAQFITGNPSADAGWTFNGNSLNNGTYIRGGGTFSYDIYTKSFVVAADDAALISKGWTAGDTVIGLGGIMVSNDLLAIHDGWATDGVTAVAGSDNTVNGVDFTTSIRIVSKFGVSPTSWSASTVKPNAGNGLGSGSGGDGGDGTIELTTNAGDIVSGNAGTLINATNAFQDTFNGSNWVQTSLSNKSFSLYEYQMSGTLLSSWEMMLDTTKLGSLYPYTNIPQPGDRLNQALQRSVNTVQFTDGLAVAAPVPEPSAAILSALGAAGLLTFSRIRARQRTT